MSEINVAEYVRKHPNCNYFISASAGTGKTYAMTNYYMGILEKNDSSVVERIIATTFTVKAATEMKQKIMSMITDMEKSTKGMKKEYWKNVKMRMSRSIITTIDSFCHKLLREENFSVDVDPNLTIMNDLKRNRVIERSIYTAFRLFFEAYEGKGPNLPNVLVGSERGKKIEKLINTLKDDKKALKVLFSEYRLDSLQDMMNDVLVNWRTEMKRSSVLEHSLLRNDIVYDALSAFKTLVLMASEVYESMTTDISEFDYKGVLEKTLNVLKTDEIRNKYSERFKYILVDEYQDTNYLQKELFDSLHNESNYIFYVGDRKQSIYRFRGSDVTVFTTTYEEFLKREKNGENWKVLSLKTNYRSEESLVEYFNELSRNTLFNRESVNIPNIEKIKKDSPFIYEDAFFREDDNSRSNRKEDEEENPSLSGHDSKRVKYVYAVEEKNQRFKTYAEAETAVKVIKALVGQMLNGNVVSYKDITILRRSLKHAEDIYRDVFKKHGVPLYVVGSHTFYSRPEIEGVISSLKAVQNPNNDYMFTVFFFSPLANGDFETFDRLVSKRNEAREKISLFKMCEKMIDVLPQNVVEAYDILKKYSDLKYYIRPAEIVRGLVNDLDYLSKLARWSNRKSALYNLKKLLNELESFDQMASSFSELIRLISKIRDKDEGEATLEDENSDSVKLMTIHKSKGLEFKVVILGGLFSSKSKAAGKEVQFSLPQGGSRYFMMKKLIEEKIGDKAQEIMKDFYINKFMDYTEERRLLYVAITRSSELFTPIFVSGKNDHIFSDKESFSKNLNVKSDLYDLVDADDIKIPRPLSQTKSHEKEAGEVPSGNLKSFESLSYKMYIAPTFLRSMKEEEKLKEAGDLMDEMIRTVSINDIFSKDEMSEGQRTHRLLSQIQHISDLKFFEEHGSIKAKQPLSNNPIIKRLFSYPFSKTEWRLMKPMKVENKTYMLFGIPDRVFMKDGKIEVIDYKHSTLQGPNRQKKLEDYTFQLRFYMYLLSDFGTPKKGYIVSTKSGEIVEVEPDEDFASIILNSIKEMEKEDVAL